GGSPVVHRSDAIKWHASRAERSRPSAGITDSGSVVIAITRPAPILTMAASCPARGPTATSGRAAPRNGATRRANASGESLPSAGAPAAAGPPASARAPPSLIAPLVQRRRVEQRVREQPLGVAPELAEQDGPRDHHHVAVAVGFVDRERRVREPALGLGPRPAGGGERHPVEAQRVRALLAGREHRAALEQHRD